MLADLRLGLSAPCTWAKSEVCGRFWPISVPFEVLSIIGMVGTNLVWACGAFRLSLKRKVFLMACQSIANQALWGLWCCSEARDPSSAGVETSVVI